MNEKEQLIATLSRLRRDLADTSTGTVVQQQQQSSCDSSGNGNSSGAKSRQRRRYAMMHEMEVAYQRLAEIEELECVECVKRESVETGMIVTPAILEDLGECPLCLQEIAPTFRYDEGPQTSRISCCGIKSCKHCFLQFKEHHEKSIAGCNEVEEALDTYAQTGEISEPMRHFSPLAWAEQQAAAIASGRCPFCRATFDHECDYKEKLLQHATAGKDWAQLELGGEFFQKEAYLEAEHWMSLAAEQDNVYAQKNLSSIWKLGYPSSGIAPCREKELQYLRAAARNGHGTAQFNCGNEALSNGDRDEAKMWFYLAAAQGESMTQASLAVMFFNVKPNGVDDLLFYRRMYWLRQSALRNESVAQELLSANLLAAQQSLFDGSCDITGYSAMPEAAFWFDTSLQQPDQHGRPVRSPLLEVSCCACCKTPASSVDGGKLRRCTKCRSVGYCGRDCQELHWKMGHKIDCKGVDVWRKALKDMVAKMPTNA